LAKYAVGYLTVMLIAALVGIFYASSTGQLRVFDRGVEERGFDVVGPPVEAPVPDLGLWVTDAAGTTRIDPVSYCFTTGDTGICADGVLQPGPSFTSTDDHPIELVFPLDWDVTVDFTTEDGSCPTYTTSLGVTTTATIDELGPVGVYQLMVFSSGPQGDASWSFRVDNQADLPLPAGVSC
jgi:hypothetical protein